MQAGMCEGSLVMRGCAVHSLRKEPQQLCALSSSQQDSPTHRAARLEHRDVGDRARVRVGRSHHSAVHCRQKKPRTRAKTLHPCMRSHAQCRRTQDTLSFVGVQFNMNPKNNNNNNNNNNDNNNTRMLYSSASAGRRHIPRQRPPDCAVVDVMNSV